MVVEREHDPLLLGKRRNWNRPRCQTRSPDVVNSDSRRGPSNTTELRFAKQKVTEVVGHHSPASYADERVLEAASLDLAAPDRRLANFVGAPRCFSDDDVTIA